MDKSITLEGFLSVIHTNKNITINLFNENNDLLITFGLSGYPALDDFLCDDEITKIQFVSITNLNVYIDTSND